MNNNIQISMRTILSVCFFSLVCIFWSREIYVPDELLRRKVKTSFRSLFCICVCGHYVLQRPLCRALRSTEQYVCIIYVFKIECSMLKSCAIKSIRCRFQMFSMLDSFFFCTSRLACSPPATCADFLLLFCI